MGTNRTISVGMRVKLKRDSSYYKQAPEIWGKIRVLNILTDISGTPWHDVSFENGYSNQYREKDLFFPCWNEKEEKLSTTLGQMLEGIDLRSLTRKETT